MTDKNNDNLKNFEEIEEEEEVIVLVDDRTGKEVEFSLLAMLEVDILINRVEFGDDGEEKFLPVDDDAELDKAFEAFDEMYVEQFGMHCDGSDIE